MNYKSELFSDEALAVMELQRDLLYQRIPKNRIKHFVDLCLLTGRREATRLKGLDLFAVCAGKNLEVELSDLNPGMGGVNFRAQISYTKESAKVTLYRQSIMDLIKSVNSFVGDSDKIDFELAKQMLTAHEFFHYLEFTEIGETADTAGKVEIAPILWKRRYARIMRCGEVAAYAFTKEFLSLPFLPNLTDYFFLVASGKWKESELARRLKYALNEYQNEGFLHA